MDERSTHRGNTTVVAIVLTYDSPDAIRRCVDAIARQTRRPDRLLIVDNASPDPVVVPTESFPGAEIYRTDANLGPAGGHAVGLGHFCETTDDDSLAWVLDDDCVPEATALERLLATATAGDRPALTFGTVTDSDAHHPVVGVGWWGVLIPHAAIRAVGLPMAELFWWAEDTEYLQWRLPRAGFEPSVARDAVIRVDRSRPSRAKPAWKYYYEARNSVYYRLRIQRVAATTPASALRSFALRTWRTGRMIASFAARILLVEREDRATKLAMVARGVADGLLGRLGATVPVSTADRPLVATE